MNVWRLQKRHNLRGLQFTTQFVQHPQGDALSVGIVVRQIGAHAARISNLDECIHEGMTRML